MLVFLDESGDTGRKLTKGSSAYFVVSLVVFDDHDVANDCDQRITLLRRELALDQNYEFHFSHNSDRVRKLFLAAIQPYNFVYYSVVINKDPKKLYGEGFNAKSSFYKYACHMVLTNAKPILDAAIVVLDKTGSPGFRSELNRYLRKKLEDSTKKKIRKVKQQTSHSNNLLQLADYVTGIINRKVQSKKGYHEYYKYISPKENWVQQWPKNEK